MQKKTVKHVIFFFVLFAILGYWREFFFVHINNIMYQKYYNTSSELKTPAIMQMFNHFSYETLYYSKYVYTVVWTMMFCLANYIALKKLSNVAFLNRVLIYTYLVMFFIALLSMAYGLMVNGRWQNDEYTVSRWLMGIAQSPIICLILLASEKLYTKSSES